MDQRKIDQFNAGIGPRGLSFDRFENGRTLYLNYDERRDPRAAQESVPDSELESLARYGLDGEQSSLFLGLEEIVIQRID